MIKIPTFWNTYSYSYSKGIEKVDETSTEKVCQVLRGYEDDV